MEHVKASSESGRGFSQTNEALCKVSEDGLRISCAGNDLRGFQRGTAPFDSHKVCGKAINTVALDDLSM